MATEYQKFLSSKFTSEQYRKLTSQQKINAEKEFNKKNKTSVKKKGK